VSGTDDFLAELKRQRATAILRTNSQAVAAAAMEAAVRGGFRHLEFTLTTPGALELVTEFSRRPDLVVGAGTVLTVENAKGAVRAGARFLVSPVMDEEVVRAAVDLGAVAIPGCHTPTELLRAHRAGAALQKLFPAPAGGPDAVPPHPAHQRGDRRQRRGLAGGRRGRGRVRHELVPGRGSGGRTLRPGRGTRARDAGGCSGSLTGTRTSRIISQP